MKKVTILVFAIMFSTSILAGSKEDNCHLEIFVKKNAFYSDTYAPSGNVESLDKCVQLLKNFMVFLNGNTGRYEYANNNVEAAGTITSK